MLLPSSVVACLYVLSAFLSVAGVVQAVRRAKREWIRVTSSLDAALVGSLPAIDEAAETARRLTTSNQIASELHAERTQSFLEADSASAERFERISWDVQGPEKMVLQNQHLEERGRLLSDYVRASEARLMAAERIALSPDLPGSPDGGTAGSSAVGQRSDVPDVAAALRQLAGNWTRAVHALWITAGGLVIGAAASICALPWIS